MIWGLFGGALVGGVVGGLLAYTGAVRQDEAIAIGVASGAATTLLLWLIRLVRASLARMGVAFDRMRARRQRRRHLALSRRYPSTTHLHDDEDLPENDETVLMTQMRRAERLDRTTIVSLLGQARKATADGQFDDAAGLFSDVIDGAPAHFEAHISRGRIFLDKSDYVRAMSDFVAAEDLAPLSPEPPIAIGDLYFARKDYARAIACYDSAIKLAPNHAMALCRRGMSHHYRKNFQVALEDLEKAFAIDRDIPNLESHLELARRKVSGPGTKRR